MIDAAYRALRCNRVVTLAWCAGQIGGEPVLWPLWLDVIEASFLIYLGVIWNKLSRIARAWSA